MADNTKQDETTPDPLASLEQNETKPQVPPNKYYSKYHKIVTSPYFRIILTVVLMLFLFLTALLIAFISESRKQSFEQVEQEIPEATVKIPTPELTTRNSSDLENDTPTWNTYIDRQLNFQIMYPNTMLVRKTAKRDELYIGGASASLIYDDNEFRPQASEIYVAVYESGELTLDDWLTKNSTTKPFGSDTTSEFYSFLNLGANVLDNIEGIKFSGEVFGFKEINTAVKNGKYIYVVGYVEVADDLSSYYDQMLSTFKFLD